MGDEIGRSVFDADDFERFRTRLRTETTVLAERFSASRFDWQQPVAGFELEAWLLDGHLDPLPSNEQFLHLLNSPLASPELARFNVEVNSTPRPIKDHVFSAVHDELNTTWQQCRTAAAKMDAQVCAIGILPTVTNEALTLANMSQMERYRALNRQVLHLRKGKPLVFDINGVEHLRVVHRDVMLESAATSFQIHLQVAPQHSVRQFNTAMLLSGPMVALCANSPYFFGKDLWDETRIPLFEQAVATGGYDGAAFGPIRRVTFGTSYVRDSLMECFQENLDHYPVMLPVTFDEPVENMRHLRLHNGTIWRWNRPLIGVDEQGRAHLRIEHRVVPAGPSLIDTVANLAFFYGALANLSLRDPPLYQELDFGVARDNFYRAARRGLRANMKWSDGWQGSARDLLLHHLLPAAADGLQQLDVSSADIKEYLAVIEGRLTTGFNGSHWQRAFVARHGRDMRKLTAAYLERQLEGKPVHEWTI